MLLTHSPSAANFLVSSGSDPVSKMTILTQNSLKIVLFLQLGTVFYKRWNQDPQRLFPIRIPAKIISLPDPRKDNFGSRSPQWWFRIRILIINLIWTLPETLRAFKGGTTIVQVRSTASVPTTCPGSATRRPMSFSCPTTTSSTTRQGARMFGSQQRCGSWHFGADPDPRICTFD
jgi:hypothetical protein